MRTIVLHTRPAEQSGVVVEDQKVIEYVTVRPELTSISGSIFVGKVERVDQRLQAAFVDIGESRNAFLRKDAIYWCNGNIEQAITEGESLFVQVIKDPIGQKGAQVTTDITFPGLYTIYQPYGKKVSVSRKLEYSQSSEIRNNLSREFSQEEGCIVRTAASLVDVEVVLEEVCALKKQWEEINGLGKKRSPQLLWQDQVIPDQLIRKHPFSLIKSIIVDEANVSQYLKKRYPPLKDKILWKANPSFDMPITINDLQDQVTCSTVDLDGGVQLVIEPTEAMTVIDVNSYKHQGSTFNHSHAYEVNKQAAREAAKQLQLRNISGMVVIDFISMNNSSLEQKLVDYIRNQMSSDSVKSTVLGMTRLGLMEITRKRDWISPYRLLVKDDQPSYTSDTEVYRLERELISRSHSNIEAIIISVHPEVMKAKKRLLSQTISSKIPQELFVRQDSQIPGWQIELEGSLNMIRETAQRRKYHVDNLF